MDTDALIDVVEIEGHAFADALERVAADAPVPTCPDWLVRDLAHHVGDVHRRIARYVGEARKERIERGEGGPVVGPDDELASWSRDGVDVLVAALRDAPDDLDCFVLYPHPTPRRMWARRMAHETAVHGLDVALAAGSERTPAVALAADGIDEVLTGIARPGRYPTAPAPFTTLVVAEDAAVSWTVRMGADEDYRVERTAGAADLRLRGSAAALYRLLWNRGAADDVTVDGDASLLAHWRAWHV